MKMCFYTSAASERSLGHLTSAELFLCEAGDSEKASHKNRRQDEQTKGEIVRDNKRQYFIKSDSGSRWSRCVDSLLKRHKEMPCVHHLIRVGYSDCLLSGNQEEHKKINEALQIRCWCKGSRCNSTVPLSTC